MAWREGARPNEETDLLNSGALEAGGGKGGIVLDALGVVGLAEVEAEVVEVLALGEMMVIGIGQEGRAHAPDEGLGESVEDVEGGHVAGGRLRCRGRHLCNGMLGSAVGLGVPLRSSAQWSVSGRCGRSSVLSWMESENEVGFGLAILRDHSKSIVLRQIENMLCLSACFSPTNT